MRGNETEPKFKYKKIPRSPLLILDYANQFNAMNETTSTQKRINLKTLKDKRWNMAPGSSAFIISTSEVYMLNGSREWVNI